MNAHDFTIWLRGFLDAVGTTPTAEQMDVIIATLNKVTLGVSVAPTPVQNSPICPPNGRVIETTPRFWPRDQRDPYGPTL